MYCGEEFTSIHWFCDGFLFFFLNHIAALKMCCAAAIAHYLTFSVSTPIPDLSRLGFCTNLISARKRGGMVVSYITW